MIKYLHWIYFRQ